MKRKTKSKSRKTDVLVVFLCLSISIFFLLLFWRDLNGMTTRTGDTAVGTITFKHRTAQRKFNDRVVWERIKQSADVYNEDTIRTAAMAEAVLTLKDGTVVNLSENSMIQIHYTEDGGVKLSLEGGDLTVDSSEASNAVSVSFSNGETAEIDSGGTIAIKSGDGEGASVDVLNGSASVKTAAGEEQKVSFGESVVVSGGEVQKSALSVISPRQSRRILKFGGEEATIPFEWRISGESKEEETTIEFSRNRNFGKIEYLTSVKNTESTEVSLGEFGDGTLYWRLFTPSTKESAVSGKIEVVQVAPPTLVSPARAEKVVRLDSKSAVFRWTQVQFAEHYRLRVSGSADMKNPVVDVNVEGFSATVDDLPDGDFWWQVTPHFSIDKIGYADSSEARAFSTATETGSVAPSLLMPGNGIKITAGEARKTQIFSWKSGKSGEKYRITLSKTETFSQPIYTGETEETRLEFPLETLANDDGASTYYWKVANVLQDGKILESETRKFSVRKEQKAAGGKITLLYPQDGFSAESEKIARTQFIWNREGIAQDEQVSLQISRSTDFSNLVLNERFSGNIAQNLSVPEGRYFWRVGFSDGGGEKWTDPRQFSVIEKLGGVSISYPVSGRDAVLYGGAPLKIEWRAVPGADCYNVKVQDADGRTVAQNDSVSAQEASFPLADGAYTASVQAVSLADENSSQRVGPVSLVHFNVRSPSGISLAFPEEGEQIAGLDALRQKIQFSWKNGQDRPESSVFVLLKRQSNGNFSEVESIPVSGERITLSRLSSGEYRWKIRASARGGIPLDSEERRFSVGQIPELPQARLTSPQQNFTINSEYLKKNRTIVFSWDSVPGATAYSFKFYRRLSNGTLKAIRTVNDTTSRRIEFKELSELDVGTFVWSVTAHAYARDGFEEQKSRAANGQFKIDINIPKTAVPLDPGRLYGN